MFSEAISVRFAAVHLSAQVVHRDFGKVPCGASLWKLVTFK